MGNGGVTISTDLSTSTETCTGKARLRDGHMGRVILVNKPFGMLCQFTDDIARPVLKDIVPVAGVYPAGRLDRDSEGLVVLTDDGRLQARLADPAHKTRKRYVVQVEGLPSDASLAALRDGVTLKDGPTRPAAVRRIAEPDWLWPRDPPIRVRRTVPDTWLEIGLTEGRNRQVRRMTAAVGHPTLRLIRWSVGRWTLDGLGPSDWREVPAPQEPEPATRLPPRTGARRRHR